MRIERHRLTRRDAFITIEEPRDLAAVIKPAHLPDRLRLDVLLNRLDESEEVLIKEIEALDAIDANIVFVLNDVGTG